MSAPLGQSEIDSGSIRTTGVINAVSYIEYTLAHDMAFIEIGQQRVRMWFGVCRICHTHYCSESVDYSVHHVYER